MDFENGSIDPYKILGVPFGASIEVCKATYRSLTKIYHPDVFVGDKSYAEKRMAELNSAYEFLNDPAQKQKFDNAGEKPSQKEQSQEYQTENDSDEFVEASKILQENWDFACEYHPELIQIHANLCKINSKIGFLLKAVIVEGQQFQDAQKIADHLESVFLETKFSSDNVFKNLAKYAILNGEIQFAKDLNKAIKILGVNSKDQILSKLSEGYPDFLSKALRLIEEEESIAYNFSGPHKAKKYTKKQLDEKIINIAKLVNYALILIIPIYNYFDIYLIASSALSLTLVWFLARKKSLKTLVSLLFVPCLFNYVIFSAIGMGAGAFSLAVMLRKFLYFF